jgi:hypothetical protein
MRKTLVVLQVLFLLAVVEDAWGQVQNTVTDLGARSEAQVGDTVVTLAQCVLQNGQTVTNLSKGIRLLVVALNGDWVACSVVVNGKEERGWINKRLVAKATQAGNSADSATVRQTPLSGRPSNATTPGTGQLLSPWQIVLIIGTFLIIVGALYSVRAKAAAGRKTAEKAAITGAIEGAGGSSQAVTPPSTPSPSATTTPSVGAGKPFSARLVGDAIVTEDANGYTVILRKKAVDAELPSDAEADAQMRKSGMVPSAEARRGFRYGWIVLRSAPLVGLTPEQARVHVQRPNGSCLLCEIAVA